MFNNLKEKAKDAVSIKECPICGEKDRFHQPPLH